MVANLPYSIATPLILRTIAELPGLESWTLMVQREIADRLRAAPGSRTYGVAERARPARLRGAAAARASTARCSRPRPRVDSALIGLRRIGPGGRRRRSRALVRDAFAHRRKSLARSLEHARPGAREPARGGARASSGCRPTRAPSSSRPQQFVALAEALGR